MNETMRKFGYPGSVVRDFDHWTVLLRPKQATLGALVLACKQPVKDFGQVSAAGFAELQVVTRAMEAALKKAFDYQKLNYLMLMMVDPDVHFHVLPRYSQNQQLAGLDFDDPGWPGPPDIAHCTETDADQSAAIARQLDQHWD
jgi:diadenosine tetraphosphate (Ap4A) HIT family hydrolase